MTRKHILGFHVGVTGNKRGIGDWMESSSGSRGSIKSTDDVGITNEALTKGVGYVGFRFTSASGNVSREVPVYENDPAEDARILCQETLDRLPGEFDKRVWLEIINEPRAQLNPGDVMYQNMNPVHYLGLWCQAAAEYLNVRGYRFCGPGYNSGEPNEEDYDEPGMLDYLRYCVANQDMAALAIHEYNWNWNDNWDEVYPFLWGRFERWIAAADVNGIPRDFSIMITEAGGSHDFAHTYDWIVKWWDKIGDIILRFPQVKTWSSWALNGGWGSVDDQVNTWIEPLTNGRYDDNFDVGEQPAQTFLGTLPGNTTPPPTDPPPGNDCPYYSDIRVRYNLLPQDTTLQELSGITGELYQLKNTFGQSHTDGMVLVAHGRQSDSTLYVYEPERRNPADMVAIEASGIKWRPVYFDKPPPNNPPGGNMIDITDYFVPIGKYGVYTVFHFDNGITQPQQLENLGGGRAVMWKGEGQSFDGKLYQDYEDWSVTADGLEKDIDTSDAGNGGRDAYDLHGAVWIPKMVKVGVTYISTPRVTRFNRTNCQVVDDSNTVDYLKVREIVPVWTSPKNANITFDDVLVIEWRKSQNGVVIETYYFAKNVGYVAWNNAAAGELPDGREPLGGDLSECF